MMDGNRHGGHPQIEALTRNSSRMKNLALVTLGSSPGSGVAVREKENKENKNTTSDVKTDEC